MCGWPLYETSERVKIMNPASFVKEGGLRARPIGVMSDALTTGLTRDELLSGRTEIST